MLTIRIPSDVASLIANALSRAGAREIGGALFAEHTGENEFTVRSATIQRRGGVAYFLRAIADVIRGAREFFSRTAHQFSRFNYLGEWHSHPSFSVEPSGRDDKSMREIVEDISVGANFVVLLILKLADNAELIGSAHTYLPDGTKARSNLLLEA